MTEPTAGPWEIEEDEDGSAYTVQVSPRYQACIIGADGTALADVRLSDLRIKRSPEEAHANACLMAASRELLAASEAQAALIRDLLKLIGADRIRDSGMQARLISVSDQVCIAHEQARGETMDDE